MSDEPRTQREQLADALHSHECRHNHTDGCDWHYESWDAPGYARDGYLKDAERMLTAFRSGGLAAALVEQWPTMRRVISALCPEGTP